MKSFSMRYAELFVALALSYSCLIDGCKSFVIQPLSWDYKGHHIGYEEARRLYTEPGSSQSLPDSKDNDVEPVLLLNGFGVGSFHQHRVMPHLLPVDGLTQNRVVYGMDYLGQGRSWPVNCDDGNSKNEEGVIYSADTWVEQIIDFIEEVILPQHKGDKIHIVGNSVGGHLAVVLAARRPDLVESICLLNATPVWGLNLPFWSGHLPPPSVPKRIGRFLFDRIRDLQTIERYLENAYANRAAFGQELIQQIRSCTEGRGGHAAFASIMWSPPARLPSKSQNFYDSLSSLHCDVLLMFGKSDPWCKPAFAKKMLNSLSRRSHPNKPVHRYLELENVGHCPNHEAPQAVGKVVRAWISSEKRSKESLTLINGLEESVSEPWAEITLGLEEPLKGINVSRQNIEDSVKCSDKHKREKLLKLFYFRVHSSSSLHRGTSMLSSRLTFLATLFSVASSAFGFPFIQPRKAFLPSSSKIYSTTTETMPEVEVGNKIPSVLMKELQTGAGKPVDVDIAELIKGKRVAIFGVPGAFTPGCSKSHLPSFMTAQDDLKAKGVAMTICIATNDPYVMEAWGRYSGGADVGIRFLSDVNAELSRALGLVKESSVMIRTKRFSLIANDGVVSHYFSSSEQSSDTWAPQVLAAL